MAGSRSNLHTMDSLSCILGMSYSVIDGLVTVCGPLVCLTFACRVILFWAAYNVVYIACQHRRRRRGARTPKIREQIFLRAIIT